jgi:anti-sigma B factor antagonist
MSKQIRIETVDNYPQIRVIHLRGFLDSMTATEFQQTTEDLIAHQLVQHIINLEHLEYVSSAGVEAFHLFAQKLQKYKGALIFVNVPEKIYRVFETIGLTTFIPTLATLPEAIKELTRDEQ